MVRFTIQTLYPWEKAPRYPMLQSQSERCGRERITCLVEETNVDSAVAKPYPVTSECEVCYARTGQHTVNI
jgi:hypothetical protein